MSCDNLKVTVNIDGGARGNPGPAGAGFVLRAQDGTILRQEGFFLGRATNNVAEYTALLKGLASAMELGAKSVEVLSDSELLVRQMTGVYRVKNAGLLPLFTEAKEISQKFDAFEIHHVRRELNTDADRMVNMAIDQRRHVED